jgi:hypothetical protein
MSVTWNICVRCFSENKIKSTKLKFGQGDININMHPLSSMCQPNMVTMKMRSRSFGLSMVSLGCMVMEKLTKSQKFDIATLLLPEKQYLCLAFSNIFVPNETKKSQVHTGNAKKALKYSTNKSSVIRNSSWKYKIYIHIITK